MFLECTAGHVLACFNLHSAYCAAVHACHSFGDTSRCSRCLNIKVDMESGGVSLIALTFVFSGEEGEFKSLMGPLHLL